MYKRLLYTLLFVLGSLLPARADYSQGKVVVQIDTLPPMTLNIMSAILYRKVNIVQDTVAFVQDSHSVRYLYGPQFVEGDQYVLQLHMVDTDSGKQFYDVGFVLGDTLKPHIELSGENATFDFDEIGENVTGTFSAQFFYKIHSDENAQPVLIRMEGEIKAPVGTYKETSIATESENLEQKRRYQRNLAIAVIITFITIAVLGL